MVRLAGVRVAARQLAVVVKHGPLQLKPLAEERQRLDLALLLLATRVVFRQRRNVFSNPHVRAGSDLLVAVDFLLPVGPLGKRVGVSPHSNLAGEVNELEVAGNSLEVLVGLASLNSNLKKSVVLAITICFFSGHSGEFLVGGVVRRSNIVGEQNLVRDDVSKSNQLLVPYDAAELLIVAGRDDLPVVVCVVVGIASDLLALAGNTTIVISQRVGVGVAVKVRLGLLVSDGNGIIVLDIDGAC